MHDLGHDGVTNQFHINTLSDYAVEYNDVSVLENYHIAYAFKLMRQEDCNWFDELPKKIQRYMREQMIKMVLGTDMKYHNTKVQQVTQLSKLMKSQLNRRNGRDSLISVGSDLSLIQTNLMDTHNINTPPLSTGLPLSNRNSIQLTLPDDEELDLTSKPRIKTIADIPLQKHSKLEGLMNNMSEHLSTQVSDEIVKETRLDGVDDERSFLLQFIVHLSDISNAAKGLKAGKKWGQRLMDEFFNQGDRERQMGVNVSPMCDRFRSPIEKSQIGFIQYVLIPSYESFVEIVPEVSKAQSMLGVNLQYWKDQHKIKTKERRVRSRSVGPHTFSILNNHHMQIKLRQNKSEDQHLNNNKRKRDINSINSFDIESKIDKNESNNNNKKHVKWKAPTYTITEEFDDDEKDELIIDNDTIDGDFDDNNNIERIIKNQPSMLKAKTAVSVNTGTTIKNRRRKNMSIDSTISTGSKSRAHSIHVSIPTSQKQVENQETKELYQFFQELSETSREHKKKKTMSSKYSNLSLQQSQSKLSFLSSNGLFTENNVIDITNDTDTNNTINQSNPSNDTIEIDKNNNDDTYNISDESMNDNDTNGAKDLSPLSTNDGNNIKINTDFV